MGKWAATRQVLGLAVRPLGQLADRANQVLTLFAVLSPLVLLVRDLPLALVLILMLVVALLLVLWAAVRLQGDITAAKTSALRFDGIEVGVPVRIDIRRDLASKESGAYVRSERIIGDESDPYLPLRAKYVNDPPLRIPAARAEGVWAELTFTDPAGTVEARIEGGRWAGEPQNGIDAPLTGPVPLSARPGAGSIDFPPNGRPESLDVVMVRRESREVLAWDALQCPYPLSGREYAVTIVLRGSPVPDLETRLRLVVPDEGDPVLEVDDGAG